MSIKRKVYKAGTKKRLPDDRPDLSVKVYLGSGHMANQIENHINIDIQPYEGCICWDFTKGLPFIKNNTVDRVLGRISFEFMPRKKVTPVLKEILRVLKPGGHFELLAQDLEAHCWHLLNGRFKDDHEYMLRKLYGRQLYVNDVPVPGTFRMTFFSYQIMAMLLGNIGFVRIQKTKQTKHQTRMLVVAHKPRKFSEEIRFLTTEGLPRGIIDGTRKPRYHK